MLRLLTIRMQVTGWPSLAVEGQTHSRPTPGSWRPVGLAGVGPSDISTEISLTDGSLPGIVPGDCGSPGNGGSSEGGSWAGTTWTGACGAGDFRSGNGAPLRLLGGWANTGGSCPQVSPPIPNSVPARSMASLRLRLDDFMESPRKTVERQPARPVAGGME